LIWMNEKTAAKEADFYTAADFPAIYQQATAMIYPSVFEGFGLPVLEALWSRLPVICSDTSSIPEAGGDAALYFSPLNTEQLANHMLKITQDTELVTAMKDKGTIYAERFAPGNYANAMMKIYSGLL